MSTITIENISKRRGDNWNGTIRERSDGRWEARISIDGLRKSFYGKTKSEALSKMRKYRSDPFVNKVNLKTVKLNEYIEHYLVVYKLGIIKASTYDRYESTYIHHIATTIGKRQLGGITSDDIQKLINQKASPVKREALSRSSIKKIVELLGMVFKHALLQKVIKENPVDSVIIPNKNNIQVQTKELFALESDELQRIKVIADSVTKRGQPMYRYAYLFMILLNTGMRCGELLALTWEDVDFENRMIMVGKSVMVNAKLRDEKGSFIKRADIVSDTKTINGERIIPLSNQALYYLKLNYDYNIAQNINSPYVAYSQKGTRATARNLQRTLDIVLEKANVRHCGLHILRHTFGSVLLLKGTEISVVSALMGHSSTKITYDKYIHVFKEQKVKAIGLLDII